MLSNASKELIGGDFQFSSLHSYLTQPSEHTIEDDIFFPAQNGTLTRVLFETGVDALAYFLIKMSGARRHQENTIAFPHHYCESTIARLQSVLNHNGVSITILRYGSAAKLSSDPLPPGTAVVLSHFNRY
jgi:hypothetical protein